MKYKLHFPEVEKEIKYVFEESFINENNEQVILGRFAVETEEELEMFKQFKNKYKNRIYKLYQMREVDPDIVTFGK